MAHRLSGQANLALLIGQDRQDERLTGQAVGPLEQSQRFGDVCLGTHQVCLVLNVRVLTFVAHVCVVLGVRDAQLALVQVIKGLVRLVG